MKHGRVACLLKGVCIFGNDWHVLSHWAIRGPEGAREERARAGPGGCAADALGEGQGAGGGQERCRAKAKVRSGNFVVINVRWFTDLFSGHFAGVKDVCVEYTCV
jgi:hypothetical protein